MITWLSNLCMAAVADGSRLMLALLGLEYWRVDVEFHPAASTSRSGSRS